MATSQGEERHDMTQSILDCPLEDGVCCFWSEMWSSTLNGVSRFFTSWEEASRDYIDRSIMNLLTRKCAK